MNKRALAIIILLSAIAHADTVKLTSGEVLRGKIKGKTTEKVVFEYEPGKLKTILLSEIAAMEKDDFQWPKAPKPAASPGKLCPEDSANLERVVEGAIRQWSSDLGWRSKGGNMAILKVPEKQELSCGIKKFRLLNEVTFMQIEFGPRSGRKLNLGAFSIQSQSEIPLDKVTITEGTTLDRSESGEWSVR